MPSEICQICHLNPATIHLTEINEGVKDETHICEACAAAQGLAHEGLVSSVLDMTKGMSSRTLKCPHCGITFDEFRAKGRFGCPRDYEVFREALEPLLRKMHGGRARHLGRLPLGQDEVETTVSDRLLQLRRELADAIGQENYEDAARLRDEINEIDKAQRAQRPWTGP